MLPVSTLDKVSFIRAASKLTKESGEYGKSDEYRRGVVQKWFCYDEAHII